VVLGVCFFGWGCAPPPPPPPTSPKTGENLALVKGKKHIMRIAEKTRKKLQIAETAFRMSIG
jgi:hypothetical protein